MVRILEQSNNAEAQADLIRFSQRRLAYFGLPHDLENDAPDLLQQSLCAVLKGIHSPDGRKPKEGDIDTRDAFANYLRGVISSTAEGWARAYHRRHQHAHCSLDQIQEWLADTCDGQIEYRDWKRHFFAQLRRQAPARLLPTIEAWEQAPDARIPCVSSRKHVRAVRLLAGRILAPSLASVKSSGGLRRN